MKIYMIGSAHYKLSCQAKLTVILKEISKQLNPPEFVAIEYDEPYFKSVIEPQRSLDYLCGQDLNYLTKYLSLDIMKQIAQCIACDAVAHILYFPDTLTIWLDSNREYTGKENDLVLLYNAIMDVIIFKDKSKLEFNKVDLLEEYKKFEYNSLINNITDDHNDSTRDAAWLKKLQSHLVSDTDKYGIIIVGENHTKNLPGRIRFLLEGLHHEITVIRGY